MPELEEKHDDERNKENNKNGGNKPAKENSISLNNNKRIEGNRNNSLAVDSKSSTQDKSAPEKTVAKINKVVKSGDSTSKQAAPKSNSSNKNSTSVNISNSKQECDSSGSNNSKKLVNNSESPPKAADVNVSSSSQSRSGNKSGDKTGKNSTQNTSSSTAAAKVQLNDKVKDTGAQHQQSQSDSSIKNKSLSSGNKTSKDTGPVSGDDGEQGKLENHNRQSLNTNHTAIESNAVVLNTSSNKAAGESRQQTNAQESSSKDDGSGSVFDHLDEGLENLVATVTEEDDEGINEAQRLGLSGGSEGGVVYPVEHENAHKWFYRDPQGEVQGPFNAAEMAEWFSAGYFTMNLMVKRGCDDKFFTLGELIKRWARVPFLPGPNPPPIRVNYLFHKYGRKRVCIKTPLLGCLCSINTCC